MEGRKLVSDLYKENLEKNKGNQKFRDGLTLVCILPGSVLVTVNLNTFVEQGELVPGGFSGLAKLIQGVGLFYFNVRISFTLSSVLFNMAPTVFAYRAAGRGPAILSYVSLLTVSVLVDQLPVVPVTDDILLIAVFGGILDGLGMSLILNNRASDGGTDLIATYLSTGYRISTPNYMLGFSTAVILIPSVLFGMNKALYSIIFQFYNTQMIGALYKKYKKKTLLTVTGNPAAVSANLLGITNHSSTIIKGFGSYSANKRHILYMVLFDGGIKKMKKRIREAHPGTLVSVLNFSNVVGNFYAQPLE